MLRLRYENEKMLNELLRAGVGFGAVMLLSACPPREVQPQPTTPQPVVAPDANVPDASAPNDATAPSAAQPEAAAADAQPAPTLCDTGAECTAAGQRAFDHQQYADAHRLFERACELNDASGCHWFGLALQHGREQLFEPDEVRSAIIMEKACTLGDQEACWILGNFYLWGTRLGGVQRDPVRAAKIYEKACGAGEAASCDTLGQCYEEGMGVSKDRAQGRKYRRRAKELGFVGE